MPLPAAHRKTLTAVLPAFVLLCLVPAAAQALGLGRPQLASVLGRPLDASFPVSLAPGEQLTDSCVRSEVLAGDARVPAGLLQARMEGDAAAPRIRLQSLVNIEEPVLRITLALGCPLRLTREFNLFLDPPAPAQAVPVAVVPPPAPVPLATVVPAAPAPVPRATSTTAAAAAPRPVAKPRPRPSGPRLVLERPEVLVQAEAARPAVTTDEQQDLPPELDAQIAALEATVAQLKAEMEARLRAATPVTPAASTAPRPAPTRPAPAAAPRLAPAAPYSDPITWLLTLGLGLVAGALAYHLARWRDERQRADAAYWRAVQGAEGAGSGASATSVAASAPAAAPLQPGMAPQVQADATPLPDEGQHMATRPHPRAMAWRPATLAAAAAAPVLLEEPPTLPVVSSTAMLATQALQVQPAVADGAVLADELLDLQQQVDFLQLLGQHDAAAELLAGRLEPRHGALPCLLLMAVCQQRDERTAFAELARQYEQRFGGPPPAWTQDLAQGRGLDGATSVVAHLQLVWADRAAAMQELQDLLARGGGPGLPRFDLPAYRDVLLLYGIARDLYEVEQRGEGVDFALPD